MSNKENLQTSNIKILIAELLLKQENEYNNFNDSLIAKCEVRTFVSFVIKNLTKNEISRELLKKMRGIL